MKLYIPTCTLNFNNIFTTESISPKSFYSQRGFGSKRFHLVEANNHENVTLLYSSCPVFSIKDEQMDNYPMVIKVESGDYPEGMFAKVNEKDGVEVYMCQRTIYLNPFNCKVYFESYADRSNALSHAKESLENKFSNLYFSHFEVRKDDEGFRWTTAFEPAEIHSDSSCGNEDAIVDRIKGFLYCYLIGANTSVSKETAKLQSVAKRLCNILSAAFSSPTKRPTEAQDKELLDCIRQFNEVYRQKDDTAVQIAKKTKEFYEHEVSGKVKITLEEFNKVLELSHVKFHFVKEVLGLPFTPMYDASNVWSCFETQQQWMYDRVIGELNDAVERVTRNERKTLPKHDLNQLVEVDGDRTVQIKDLDKKNFYEDFVRSLVQGDYKNVQKKKGCKESVALALTGGEILKGYYKDNWEGNEVQTYINQLIANVADGASFDISSIGNETLMSFAAFCQKGESVDKLLAYLESIGMGGAKLALGLVGAARGFADLPKTFTSQLIDGDGKYFESVYLTVYKDLFGVELTKRESPAQATDDLKSNVAPAKPDGNLPEEGKKCTIEEFMRRAKEKIGKTAAYKALNDGYKGKLADVVQISELKSDVRHIVNPKLPKKDKKKFQEIEERLEEIFRSMAGTNVQTLIDSKANTPEQQPSSAGGSIQTVLSCTSWIEDVLRFAEGEKVKAQLKKDLQWFVENYKPEYHDPQRGIIPGRYANESKDIKSILGHLETYLRDKSKKKIGQDWLREMYKSVDTNGIISFLKNKFGV